MKCTNKYLTLILILCFTFLATRCQKELTTVTDYEKETYNTTLRRGELFASDLCVTNEEISLSGYTENSELSGVGLFSVDGKDVLYSQSMFEQIFPASTTKILTALVVLNEVSAGSVQFDDIVTVSAEATNFAIDEQVCGLRAGDQLTLLDLLNGLLLYSGNDNAVAIAEYISGSVDEFSTLMNQTAQKVGATKTHFVNPHGLHDENHYTTAYDLYLIFNECIKNQTFVDIIGKNSYTTIIKDSTGLERTVTWEPTSYYKLGLAKEPSNVTVVGGKTGTTKSAGACIILLETDSQGNNYISIVMGAETRDNLYVEMSRLIESLPTTN